MHAECRGTALKGVQGTEEVCCDMTDSFLSEMGIVVWHRRHPGGMLPENRSLDADGLELPNGFPDQGESTYGLEHVDLRTLDLPALARVVASCERCELHRSRTRTVFGNGAPDADLLIIGEAPGQNEDQQGEPFVGRAGQLLTRMLAALGLSRSAVYISNAVKCRPPSNRDPRREETEACSPFLDRQITLLRPRVILAVGRVAAQTLLSSDASLGRLRGQTHRLPDTKIPLVVTYHPAYLLRAPSQKKHAWVDLLTVRELLCIGSERA